MACKRHDWIKSKLKDFFRMENVPDIWKYTQNRRKITARVYIGVVIVVGVLCWLADMQFINTKSDIPGWIFRELLSPCGMKYMQNLFDIVWETSITITIFMLGLSNQYRYGIALKTVIHRSFGKGIIYVGAALYLLLCPFMYLFVQRKMNWSAVWCIGTVMISFGLALYFSVRIFRVQSVRQLLRDLTYKELTDKRRKRKDFYEFTNTHSRIDRLPLTDFIIHINYANADETHCLIDTLSSVLRDVMPDMQERYKIEKNEDGEEEKQNRRNAEKITYMTLLMTWAGHIIYNSGFKTEEEKSRTVRILYELWEKTMNADGDRGGGDNGAVLLIQMLIPFIEISGDTGRDMMERMIMATGGDAENVVLYLLLYTEYRYWFENNSISRWFRWDKPHLKNAVSHALQGNAKWNVEMAWNWWKAWRMYNTYDGQLGLEIFYRFSDDIERLRLKRKYEVRSNVLIEAVEEEMG